MLVRWKNFDERLPCEAYGLQQGADESYEEFTDRVVAKAKAEGSRVATSCTGPPRAGAIGSQICTRGEMHRRRCVSELVDKLEGNGVALRILDTLVEMQWTLAERPDA
jgi:hypothetical protein